MGSIPKIFWKEFVKTHKIEITEDMNFAQRVNANRSILGEVLKYARSKLNEEAR